MTKFILRLLLHISYKINYQAMFLISNIRHYLDNKSTIIVKPSILNKKNNKKIKAALHIIKNYIFSTIIKILFK